MKSRILVLFFFIISLWGMLLFRAALLQIFPNDRLKAMNDRQFQTVITLQNRRGAIMDRKGRELAASNTAFSVYADPKIIEGKKSLAKKVAKILGITPESITSKIKGDEKRFIWLSRFISKEKAEQIRNLEIRGLSVVEEYKRAYPNENLLAQTLGMVGLEGQGLEGLELQYDQYLRGNKKKVLVRRDARGRPLIADGMMFAENPDGAEIRLTVDSEMQYMLENELKAAVEEFDADQAFGIILDAQTSAVYAIVNTHSFDANKAQKVRPEWRRNRIVTDSFEPGSTLKTFAIAGALRDKMITPNKRYNTENGSMKVADRIIREAESSHSWNSLTVSEILAYSSNIGTAKIAFEMGSDRLRQTLVDFGFGNKTGIDLPGEAKGSLQPLPWNQHLLSNISFGQGIAINMFQIANAYAAIANGGNLNTPYIVHSIRDMDSGEAIEMKPKHVRRVLTPEDAAAMRMMLTGVTSPGGTGVNARVEGFLIAGKTGTAQKVNPTGRGYLPQAYISSFAGFFPANDPKFVIYIAVDQPRKANYYGSVVAAPVFSRVASYAARMEGLAPILLSEKNLVHRQTDRPVEKAEEKSFEKSSEQVEMQILPDLRKLSVREAISKISNYDGEVKIVGQGLVAETIPSGGTSLKETKKITIIFR